MSFFFFSRRRRHTRSKRDWSSDVCSSDLYHGHVDGLLVKTGSGALTHGQPDSAGVPQAFADLTISLPFNNADVVRKAFAENKGKIAAVIVEPVPANAGLYLPSDDFLSMLRNECTANGTLLIFD